MAKLGRIDAMDMANHITLTVKIKRVRQYRFRLRLTVLILRVAAFVSPCPMEIDNSSNAGPDPT